MLSWLITNKGNNVYGKNIIKLNALFIVCSNLITIENKCNTTKIIDWGIKNTFKKQIIFVLVFLVLSFF